MNKFNLKYSRADGKREEAEGWDRKRTADGWQKDIRQKNKFDAIRMPNVCYPFAIHMERKIDCYSVNSSYFCDFHGVP